MKFTDESGRQWEWLGGTAFDGDQFLVLTNNLSITLYRVRDTVTYGGVTFEYTGEKRAPRRGEWIRGTQGPECAAWDFQHLQLPILRPVRVETEQEAS